MPVLFWFNLMINPGSTFMNWIVNIINVACIWHSMIFYPCNASSFARMLDMNVVPANYSLRKFLWQLINTVFRQSHFIVILMCFFYVSSLMFSLKAIEKAIVGSDLGVTPSNDGEVIRLSLPQPTSDRRKVCLQFQWFHRVDKILLLKISDNWKPLNFFFHPLTRN